MWARLPATTQSAVRWCFTLRMARSPFEVLTVERLRHYAVEARTLEVVEPHVGDVAVGRRGSEVHGRARIGEELLEPGAPFDERPRSQIVLAVGEQVERDEADGDLGGELLDAAGCGMDAQRQQVEVEAIRLVATTSSPSTTARSGSASRSGSHDLGEVARERAFVAAAELDVVAVAEDDAPEAVPLRLERPAIAVGQRRASAFANIGDTGGGTGSAIVLIPTCWRASCCERRVSVAHERPLDRRA